MHMIRKLGWATLLATTVAIAGCDDDDNNGETTLGTSATATATDTDTATGADTDPTTTDPTAGDESGDESTGGSAGCEDAPSHATDIQPIWDASCVTGCHTAGGSWPYTDLSSGVAFDALVDADGTQTMALTDYKLVIAGDVEHSYLVNKLRNTQEAVAGAAGGIQMPSGADPLSEDQIALVEEWIACGAEP